MKKRNYADLTPREQALLRPDMWIGTHVPHKEDLYILDDGLLKEKEIEIVPSLVKIIEEVIVNSSDEHRRTLDDREGWILNEINVNIEPNGHVNIRDNGGITTKYNNEKGCYISEMIFGKLFASSNYDENDKKKVVGKNGVGSTLANIYSTRFSVSTSDTKGNVFVEWNNNMADKKEAVKTADTAHFTEVDFHIDMKRFGLKTITHGCMKYLESLCIFIAGANPNLKVTFNDETFCFNSFKDYVKLYDCKQLIGEKNEHWEWYFSSTDIANANQFKGLVNGVKCDKGSHQRMLLENLYDIVKDEMKDGKKKIDYPSLLFVRKYVFGFCNITVVNPIYEGQLKDELNNDIRIERRGSKVNIPFSKEVKEELRNTVVKDIIKQWNSLSNSQEKAELKKAKTLVNKKNSANTVKKLIDATTKGKKKRLNCELWCFEGESAGTGFRSARDPKLQGSFFFKGKPLATYDKRLKEVLDNAEFLDYVKAIGLNPLEPNDLSMLRYGKINVATDADVDGDCIFAYIACFFAVHFPIIIEKGMLNRVITPLYRVKKKNQTKYFYTQKEYDAFKKRVTKGWESSYFKGLGSLEPDDYRDMVHNPRIVNYTFDESDNEAMEVWFGSNAKLRKNVLEREYVDTKVNKNVRSLSNFLYNEFQLYSLYTIKTKIPNLYDGLKMGARKIMYSALNNLSVKKSEKFLNLAGSTYKDSLYHHGDASLNGTIVTLAQDFADTLAPLKIEGNGGDLRNPRPSAPRYLDIKLSEYAELYKKDKDILIHNYDSGQRIEPKYYLPIIPLSLFKRTSGIAMGYNYTSTMSYSLESVIDGCLSVLNEEEIQPLEPFVKDFNGVLERKGDDIYSKGIYEVGEDYIKVFEMPLSQTFESFENNLKSRVDKGHLLDWTNEKDPKTGKSFYTLKFNKSDLEKLLKGNKHHKRFNLEEKINKPTLCMIDDKDVVLNFNNVEEIVYRFVNFRLTKYDVLKENILNSIKEKIEKTSNMIRFLDLFLTGVIKIDKNTTIKQTEEQLISLDIDVEVLKTPFSKLTKDEFEKLLKEKEQLEAEYIYTENTEPKDMYINDLKELKTKYNK